MPTNPGSESQAERTNPGSVVALRRDVSPNPYLARARMGSSPSASDSDAAAESPSAQSELASAQGDSPSAQGDSRSAQGDSRLAQDNSPSAQGESPAASGEEPPQQPKVVSSHVVHTTDPDSRAGEEGKGAREVVLPPLPTDLPLTERPAVALQMGHEAFTQTGYWISFYRAILGPEGVIHRLFPTSEQMEYFEQTPEFLELHKMLTALRTTDEAKIDAVEPQTMITVRLPRSLQAMLVEEARKHAVSTNKLCISKLLMPISPMFVPEEKGKIRGRKPGQQARYNRLKSSKLKKKS